MEPLDLSSAAQTHDDPEDNEFGSTDAYTSDATSAITIITDASPADDQPSHPPSSTGSVPLLVAMNSGDTCPNSPDLDSYHIIYGCDIHSQQNHYSPYCDCSPTSVNVHMPPWLSDDTQLLILPDGSILWPPVVTGASGSAAEAGAVLAEAPLADASTSSASLPVEAS